MGELGRTIRGLAYDPVHDEIVVPNALADAILVFRGDAIGAVAPIRIIQGSRRNWYHRMLSALTGLTARSWSRARPESASSIPAVLIQL